MYWFGVDDCEPWADPIIGTELVLAGPEVTVDEDPADWVFVCGRVVKQVGCDCKILG